MQGHSEVLFDKMGMKRKKYHGGDITLAKQIFGLQFPRVGWFEAISFYVPGHIQRHICGLGYVHITKNSAPANRKKLEEKTHGAMQGATK